MLKFDGIPVGTKIRAYDFKPMSDRDDMFIEGIITESDDNIFGKDVYEVTVTKDTAFDTQPRDVVYVPKEVLFMEYDNRIVVL